MNRVAVVIPALNAAATLRRQLTALNNQTDLAFRVVVSVNGSSDETAAIARSWQSTFEGAEVVDASHRRGVASARNVAIQATDAELVLICDADDRVHPGWVAAMRETLGTFDAATGPLVAIWPDGRKEVWNARSVPESMGYLHYAPGGNIGLRRECFDRLGGFRVDMTLGQEDVDFGWRMGQAGMTIGHHPGAALDYYQREGLLPFLRQQWRYGRAHVALYLRHPDAPIKTASWKTSLRWFAEWAKQLPGKVRQGQGQQAVGGAVFQLPRCIESLRERTATPL